MMNKVLSFFSRLINKVKSYFPSALPVGVTEFDAWATSIIALAKAPDNDSLRFAIAAMVHSLGASRDKISKHYMVKLTRKGMANQVAGGIMWDLKEKQKAAELAAKQLAASNATAPSNVHPIQNF